MRAITFNRLLMITFFAIVSGCTEKKPKIIELAENNSIAHNLYPSDTVVIATHSEFTKQHYPERIAVFKNNPLVLNDIVFLGNSITEQGGNWGQKVSNNKARNRGISGDTTEGVLARVNELIYYKPDKIFILIGINDLFRNDMTPEKVSRNILQIVKKIHDGSPQSKLYIQTILPTSTRALKDKINKTNKLISDNQESFFEIIPLHDAFIDNEGLMNMELSNDGVHLNEKGYELWIKNIINLI